MLIPDLTPELIFKASRSGGKGGQNVNKVSTKIELNFHIGHSQILNEEQKRILTERLGHRLTKDGMLQIISQSHRTQLGNKDLAIQKLKMIIAKALMPVKKRKATKPSKSSREKRLLTKKKHSEIKKMRRKDI